MADLRGRTEHAWFRARLDAQAFGLLEEAEARRFADHASSCPECEEVLKAFSENAARLAREGHIPAGILARWDRSKDTLRGMSRRMVREHLENCADCRQDLEAIGFVPELAHDPALDGEGDDSEAEAGVARGPLENRLSPAPAEAAHTIRIVRSPSGWAPWLLGAGAGAALATAATIVLVPTMKAPDPVSTAPPAPVQTDLTPTDPGFVLDPLPPRHDLQGTMRDGVSRPNDVPVAPATRFLQLGIPELFLSDTTTLSLHIVGPDGAKLVESRGPYATWQRKGVLLGSAQGPLAPGLYHLTVSAPFAANPAVADFAFRIQIMP